MELGATTIKSVRGGIRFQGSLELAYRACLWSRTASRVLLLLAEFPVAEVECSTPGFMPCRGKII